MLLLINKMGFGDEAPKYNHTNIDIVYISLKFGKRQYRMGMGAIAPKPMVATALERKCVI